MDPELLKLLADLKRNVDEKIVPKEQLLTMVSDAVKLQMGNHAEKQLEETRRFDVIPEPKSLVKRFKLDKAPAEMILKADNVKRDMFNRPIISRDANGNRCVEHVDERMTELQRAADRIALVHGIMSIAGPQEYRELANKNPYQAIRTLKSFEQWNDLTEGLKATITSTTSGSGDEWVPTNFSNQLTDAIVLAHVVAALFTRIPIPTEPFTVPTQRTKPKASVVAEGAAPATTTLGAGQFTTTNKSLSTKIFKYFLDFTDEVMEDSIIAMEPYIRKWIVLGLVRAEEDMIVNGDATGAHMDSDITNAEEPAKAFDGLRQFGSTHLFATGNPDPFTAAAVRNTRALLSVGFRENPSDLVYITSGLGLLNMIQIAEVLTLDKIGSQATILSGQLASFDGSPVIVSEHCRENLNASGVYDGVTTNRTIIICAHTPSFVTTSRRDPRVEMDKAIKTSVNTLVASMRRGFKDLQDSATFANVAIAVNIN